MQKLLFIFPILIASNIIITLDTSEWIHFCSSANRSDAWPLIVRRAWDDHAIEDECVMWLHVDRTII